jgi:hypothetical protein
VGYPQDEDHEVESIRNRARRSYVVFVGADPAQPEGELMRFPDYYYEDENKDDGAQDTGQTTPPKNTFLLIHCLHLGILPRIDVLT